MSINDINLIPELLGELYGQQLVAPENRSVAVNPTPQPVLLGNFKKKTLILVNEKTQAYISDEDLKLLVGILTACNLSMEEIGVLNLTNSPIQLADQIHDQLRPTAWWLFGVDSAELGMDPMNDPGLTHAFRGRPVFWSPALSELAENPAAKRLLWGQLKKQYGV